MRTVFPASLRCRRFSGRRRGERRIRMASTREKVVCILYFFAVTNTLNVLGYIVGFHRQKGEMVHGRDYYFMLETFLNLVSDFLLLNTLHRPPPSLFVLTDKVLAFVAWNGGTSFICYSSHLLWCYTECRMVRVDLEKIPYNRDAATHRNILFVSSTFQYTAIFIFKITLLTVVYKFYQELQAKKGKKPEVAHRKEARDSAIHESGHEITCA